MNDSSLLVVFVLIVLIAIPVGVYLNIISQKVESLNKELSDQKERLSSCENGIIASLIEAIAINARLDGVNYKNAPPPPPNDDKSNIPF